MELVRFLNQVEAQSVEDLLKRIGADFTAKKYPIMYGGSSSPDAQVYSTYDVKTWPRNSIVVRNDTKEGIGCVGSDYHIIQYADALRFLDSYIEDGSVTIRGAYSLDNGAKIYAAVNTSEPLKLTENETLDSTILISTSHDGSGKLVIRCAPVHNATKTVITPTEGTFALKHTRNVKLRIAECKVAMKKAIEYFKKHEESFQKLVTTPVTMEHARIYFKAVFPKDNTRHENIRNKLLDIFTTNPLTKGLASCRFTMFGCFMAVVLYADYYKTKKRSRKRSEEDAAILSSLDGSAAKMKAEALSFAFKL